MLLNVSKSVEKDWLDNCRTDDYLRFFVGYTGIVAINMRGVGSVSVRKR